MELKLILQIVGICLGLLYLWLEFKANIWLWVVGMAFKKYDEEDVCNIISSCNDFVTQISNEFIEIFQKENKQNNE